MNPEDQSYMSIREIVQEIRSDQKELLTQFHHHLRQYNGLVDRVEDIEHYKADKTEVVTRKDEQMRMEFQATAKRYLVTTLISILSIGVSISLAIWLS